MRRTSRIVLVLGASLVALGVAGCLGDGPSGKGREIPDSSVGPEGSPGDGAGASGGAGNGGGAGMNAGGKVGAGGSGATGGVAGGGPGGSGTGGGRGASDAGTSDGSRVPDGGVPDTGASTGGGTSTGGSSAGGSSSGGKSGAGGTAPPVCVAANNSCTDPSTLSTCNASGTGFTTTSCAAGCVATPTPHCGVLHPTAPVVAADLARAGVKAVTIPSGVTIINTDLGSISGGITRDANVVSANVEVSANGIAYHQASDGTGVFTFQTLTIAAGATVKLVGTSPAALVAVDDMFVYGVIDARPMDASGTLCADLSRGPGGQAAGPAGMPGPTPTSGSAGNGPGAGGGGVLNIQGDPGGGGGAGHAAKGGDGGAGCHTGSAAEGGGAGGAIYSSGIRGGSSGGSGGSSTGLGGGGGGAVQLAAGAVITIGDGTNVGGVNAGGCGGKGGGGAGGGGAGGNIVVEAPVVQIRAKGTLATNGGGGGGGGFSAPADGEAGALSAVRALGAGSSQVSQLAGYGGAADSPGGTAAFFACGTGTEGLGGGGSAGPIRIIAKGATPSVNAQAVLSPSVASGATAYVPAVVPVILDRFRLDGRVALVTGAGRGIGRGIAVCFAEAGADVICAARTESELDEVAAAIRALGRRALVVRCDMTETAQIEALSRKALGEFGHVDVLVNNAGGWPPSSLLKTTEASFEDAFRFNVLSAFSMSKPIVAAMQAGAGGVVLNVSSALSHLVEKPFVVYGTCKAALNHMTRLMAHELAPKVRVNALAVGAVETSALAPFIAMGDLRKTMESLTPLGRIGTPEDIAAAALYLCSSAGEWVTGKVFEVDGGTTASNWPLDMSTLGI